MYFMYFLGRWWRLVCIEKTLLFLPTPAVEHRAADAEMGAHSCTVSEVWVSGNFIKLHVS